MESATDTVLLARMYFIIQKSKINVVKQKIARCYY